MYMYSHYEFSRACKFEVFNMVFKFLLVTGLEGCEINALEHEASILMSLRYHGLWKLMFRRTKCLLTGLHTKKNNVPY